jgi:hypothetical protein
MVPSGSRAWSGSLSTRVSNTAADVAAVADLLDGVI